MTEYVMFLDPKAKTKFRNNSKVVKTIIADPNFENISGNAKNVFKIAIEAGDKQDRYGLMAMRFVECVPNSAVVFTLEGGNILKAQRGPSPD